MANIDENGYIIVPNALSSDTCQILSNYACFKANTNSNIYKKSDPLLKVHREYGDPLMESFFSSIQVQVEKALNKKLWPTLTFYYVYYSGSELAKHKDRKSCEYVASICLGLDENSLEKGENGKLKFVHNGNINEANLGIGDMVIFKGSETPHWREKFTGKWLVSVIFAYVDKDGPFAYMKYDLRKKLGTPHIGMFNWVIKSNWRKLIVK